MAQSPDQSAQMEFTLQDTETSNDPETKGFSLSAGNTWIYPENYPIRQYQFNIVQSALYQNTLVCLPTGTNRIICYYNNNIN